MASLTLTDVIKLLITQIDLCGSQKTVAFNFGISPQYLSDILRHRREPGGKVLRVLGLKKVVTYENE